MRPLVIATKNKGKVAEFKKLLGLAFDCQLLDGSIPDVVEDGSSYRENAVKKAAYYFKATGLPVLADDSGLEVDLLGGKPGIYSARFGGAELSWNDRWNFLIRELAKFPTERWTARFRCVLCYFDGEEPKYFEGLCEGLILPTAKGSKGFGYDPIFYSSELRLPFGEASAEDKDRVSHRALATAKFLAWASAKLS